MDFCMSDGIYTGYSRQIILLESSYYKTIVESSETCGQAVEPALVFHTTDNMEFQKVQYIAVYI